MGRELLMASTWTNPVVGVIPGTPFAPFEAYIKATYPTFLDVTYESNMNLGRVMTMHASITAAQMTSFVADLQLQFPALF
jgi:hypothetical protein